MFVFARPLKGQKEKDLFEEGDVRQRSLQDIWFDPNLFAFNRKWKVSDLKGACRTCGYNMLCRGGAKCVSAHLQAV